MESEYDIDVLAEMFKHMKIMTTGVTTVDAGIEKIAKEASNGGYLCIVVDPDYQQGGYWND
jgi:hypothetical protein